MAGYDVNLSNGDTIWTMATSAQDACDKTQEILNASGNAPAVVVDATATD